MKQPTGVWHSADREWWWSGSQWKPAWSPDRAWWFNGVTWQAASVTRHAVGAPRLRVRLARAEMVVTALWFVLWIHSVVWAAIAVTKTQDVADSSLPTGLAVSGTSLLAAAVVGTVVTAAWLANRARWPVIGLPAVYVCGLFAAWYFAAMVSVPLPAGQPDTQDDMAAVGLILLALPTAAVVGLLVGFGTVIGATIRALRKRRSPSTRPA